MISLILIILTSLLPSTFAKGTPTFTAAYSCLTIATSHQSGVTKLRPNLTALANDNGEDAVYFDIKCNVGAKSFNYECSDDECCQNTGGYITAKLPKVRSELLYMSCLSLLSGILWNGCAVAGMERE